jgi:hypothetical protein
MKRIGKLMEGMLRAGSNPGAARPASPPPANAQPAPRNAPTPEVKPSPISEEAIRARAHQIWLARGGGEGDGLADWIQAEKELGARSRTT